VLIYVLGNMQLDTKRNICVKNLVVRARRVSQPSTTLGDMKKVYTRSVQNTVGPTSALGRIVLRLKKNGHGSITSSNI
jgi:hypothetical protein